MRQTIVIAVPLAALLMLAAPVRAGILDDCNQAEDNDLRIGGCTAVIRSGEYSGRNLSKAYNNRGIAYNDLGEYTRAIENYDQALRIDPNYAVPYNNRGVGYKNLGDYARAIEDYDQAVRLDPGYADAYNSRGVAHESLGHNQQAAADWEQAIRIDGASRGKSWQKYLKSKGHYSGAIDGVLGPATRRALVACAYDPDC